MNGIGTVLIFLLLGVVLYWLYSKGYLTTKCVRAWLYIGSLRKHQNCSKATVSGCSGFTKRGIRVKESRPYRFMFQGAITSGTITAEVQNARKETLLSLDEAHPEGYLHLEHKKIYYLVIRYRKADGSYQLHWV